MFEEEVSWLPHLATGGGGARQLRELPWKHTQRCWLLLTAHLVTQAAPYTNALLIKIYTFDFLVHIPTGF